MMDHWFEEVLDRYGQAVTVRRGDETVEARAFFQPVTQQQEAAPFTVTALGTVDDRLWLYLGTQAEECGDTVIWNGKDFRVRSSRPYYVGTVLSHWWAMLEAEREAQT